MAPITVIFASFAVIFSVIFASFAVKFAVKKITGRYYLLILLLYIINSASYSQSETISETISSIAEDLASDDSDTESATLYIERLSELKENPVRINSGDEQEISRLFFLTDFQVKVLADYVRKTGNITSRFELANIPGFDRELAEMITPFITFITSISTYTDNIRWHNTLLTNLSYKSGSDDSELPGSDIKILSKYKFTAGALSGGITAEKDPGEKLLDGDPPKPDFISANLVYTGHGIFRKIIAGDYSARFGQGTNINTGIRNALSLSSQNLIVSRSEIRPYTSADENNFLRGIAGEFGVKKLKINLFFSKNFIDATLGSSTGLSDDYIKSFYKSGIHNSSSSLMKKDAVSVLVKGLDLMYNFKNLRLGILVTDSRLSLPMIPDPANPASVFNFTGDRNTLYTLHYNSVLNKTLLFGEVSISESNKYAMLQGVTIRPSARLTVNFLFRRYENGYYSLYGKGPGINTSTGNEYGLISSFSFEAARNLFISGGTDLYSFPWLRYRSSSPTYGKKQEIKIKYLPSKRVSFDATYNYRVTISDDNTAPGVPEQKLNKTSSVKWSVRYMPIDDLTLITRIDLKTASGSDSRGTLLLQDINFRFRKIPVSLWTRFCIYNINGWDARIYTYENDLLYSFSIPALSGTGNRNYIMVKWEPDDHVDMRIKYTLTSPFQEAADLQNREEIKIQFKIWF